MELLVRLALRALAAVQRALLARLETIQARRGRLADFKAQADLPATLVRLAPQARKQPKRPQVPLVPPVSPALRQRMQQARLGH